MYYGRSKKFLEASKRRLAGDTARAATPDEVKGLRQEARVFKEVVAEQTLGLRLPKKQLVWSVLRLSRTLRAIVSLCGM
jgi:transposase